MIHIKAIEHSILEETCATPLVAVWIIDEQYRRRRTMLHNTPRKRYFPHCFVRIEAHLAVTFHIEN